MKFKFVYAKHKIIPKWEKTHEQWYLLIDTVERLRPFIGLRMEKMVSSYNFVRKRTLETNKGIYKGHYTDMDAYLIETKFSCRKPKEGETIFDDILSLSEYTEVYEKAFYKGGPIVVNSNNGFRHVDETFEFLKTIEKDELIFPVSDSRSISVNQWPEGTHYYAKIGNTTVYDEDGNMKWSSYEKSHEEAKKFLLRNGAVLT